jgi:hypothetical protein
MAELNPSVLKTRECAAPEERRARSGLAVRGPGSIAVVFDVSLGGFRRVV